MIPRLLAYCGVGAALLLVSGCADLAVEQGTVVLQPTRTATYKLEERAIDFLVCGFDRAPFPLNIYEADLRPDEVGAGFMNWFRHENLCRRRYSWALQGLVQFDAQPLRDLDGLVGVKKATLRVTQRQVSIGDPPRLVRWISDGLSSTNCPQLRIPLETWDRGWHDVTARADLVETGPFISDQPIYLYAVYYGDHAFDVTTWVRRLLRSPSRPFEVAFESVSDQMYQNNNEFCLQRPGAFSLEVEYERIVRADP